MSRGSRGKEGKEGRGRDLRRVVAWVVVVFVIFIYVYIYRFIAWNAVDGYCSSRMISERRQGEWLLIDVLDILSIHLYIYPVLSQHRTLLEIQDV